MPIHRDYLYDAFFRDCTSKKWKQSKHLTVLGLFEIALSKRRAEKEKEKVETIGIIICTMLVSLVVGLDWSSPRREETLGPLGPSRGRSPSACGAKPAVKPALDRANFPGLVLG